MARKREGRRTNAKGENFADDGERREKMKERRRRKMMMLDENEQQRKKSIKIKRRLQDTRQDLWRN